MAQPAIKPSMPMPGGDSEHDENYVDIEDADAEKKPGSKKTNWSFSGTCPHKAFPPTNVDRNQFKTQRDYVTFLMKNPLEDYPWYRDKPQKLSRPGSATAIKRLEDAKRLYVKARPSRKEEEIDPSRYIVLEKQPIKRKKKTKKPTGMDFEIKVTKELEFLLGVMADAKEVVIQKAIDYQRQKEEAELRARETGDIVILRSIVQGMMFKVMEEHEESELKKKEEEERSKICPKKKNKKSKKKKGACKKICPDESGEYDEDKEAQKQLCLQRQKRNEQTTKDLISFLKDLMEVEEMKRAKTYEDKAVSPYTSEQELQTIVYSEVGDEFLEEEEDVADEVEEEEEVIEIIDGDDNLAEFDMNEVKRKLEDLQMEEEVAEEEFQYEDEEEVVDQLVDESLEPLTKDASAQFNYFLERQAILAKKPKNITDDLAQFLRVVIMGDENLREVMKEKELLEFKRKQLDFMTMGMLLKKPNKCKHKEKKKPKCLNICCPKNRHRSKKSLKKVCEDADLMYKVRPNEFMLMLQVLMNILDVLEEQDRLFKKPDDYDTITEASTTIVPEEIAEEGEEEEEEDINDDDDL